MSDAAIIITPLGAAARSNGARWSASGGTFQPGEFLGTFSVSDGFTIDPGPRTRGKSSLGGPAATAVFSVYRSNGSILVATATLTESQQFPIIDVIAPAVPPFSDLDLYAPSISDINLTAFALVLAAL